MTSIEWTRGDDGTKGKTWNPVVGCTRVSAGCDACYAMGVAHRGLRPEHRGLTKLRPKDASRPGVDWNGVVKFLPDRLTDPMRWRKPRRVFVNSMSDLFHEHVSYLQIATVFAVMGACPQHTFQVLTKRPERARLFFAFLASEMRASGQHFAYRTVNALARNYLGNDVALATWDLPLSNVHLGVSVEDQATADERIPLLLGCPAAIRFVSYEPALGPVDFRRWVGRFCYCPGAQVNGDPCDGWKSGRCVSGSPARLDWIIVGGESGPRARPFDVAWARSVIRECREWGTPAFVKQLGSRPCARIEPTGAPDDGGDFVPLQLDDRNGGEMDEWTGPLADLRVREFPKQPQPQEDTMKKHKGTRDKRSKKQSRAAKVTSRARRRTATQETLAADGKPIDDGRARLDKVERWEAERVSLKAERSQLKTELDSLDAKIRGEIKGAGLELYRTDEGRIITIRVKETAASRPAPKAKPRKRREAEQAVAAQA